MFFTLSAGDPPADTKQRLARQLESVLGQNPAAHRDLLGEAVLDYVDGEVADFSGTVSVSVSVQIAVTKTPVEPARARAAARDAGADPTSAAEETPA